MISYFPKCLPDELFSHSICRAFKHDGYASNIGFGQEVFKGKFECIDYCFINSLKPYLRKMVNAKEVINNNTLIPYYSLTLGLKRKELLNQSYKFDREALKHLAIPKINNCFLKYCPLCYKNDREEHGEAYLHRIHQVVSVCPIHKCKLKICDIKTHKIKSASFDTLEDIVVDEEEVEILNDKDINVLYSRFVFEILKQKPLFTNASISQYLRGLTPIKYYLDKSLTRISSKNLFSDIKRFYSGFYDFDLSKYRVSSIYNGTQVNVRSYLLIAFFLGLTPEQSTNIRNIKKNNRFVKKVIRLYQVHHSIKKVSSITDVDKRIIRRIVTTCFD